MYKLRFKAPYKPNGKTNFPEALSHPGVYLIKENGKLVYIGMSQSNVYKTMYRHFQSWDDNRQIRVTYKDKMKRNDYTARVVYCTAAQAARLEAGLILKHRPRDNENKFDQYTMDFQDKKVLSEYEATPTIAIEDVPF